MKKKYKIGDSVIVYGPRGQYLRRAVLVRKISKLEMRLYGDEPFENHERWEVHFDGDPEAHRFARWVLVDSDDAAEREKKCQSWC